MDEQIDREGIKKKETYPFVWNLNPRKRRDTCLICLAYETDVRVGSYDDFRVYAGLRRVLIVIENLRYFHKADCSIRGSVTDMRLAWTMPGRS